MKTGKLEQINLLGGKQMKKLGIIAIAVLLVGALTIPAAALENTFGGYWRTTFMYYDGFTGNDLDESADTRAVETRTRLYYTAKINDNLSFINKFEFDDIWGNRSGSKKYTFVDGNGVTQTITVPNNESYTDHGTDGVGMEIKNSYIDANALGGNWKIGAQYFGLARGILYDDDSIGLKAIYKAGEGVILPFIWIRVNEGQSSFGMDADNNGNEQDTDLLTFAPKIYFSKDISINPYIVWLTSQDFTAGQTMDMLDNLEAWVLGFDFDANFDAFSFWLTMIYETGDGRFPFGSTEYLDIEAYGGIIGGSGTFGNVTVSGELGYATGDDEETGDKVESFYAPYGAWDYGECLSGTYWGWQTANNSPGGEFTDIMYGRLVLDVKINDKMSLGTTFVYAELDQPVLDVDGDEVTDLGFDIGVNFKWKVIDDLTWDFYGGYLLAGSAVDLNGDDPCDPWSLNTRLSLSF
jgi:hypothetical protein